jgi:multidrug efflux pump subunit AcrA (membrane-fusion protein)
VKANGDEEAEAELSDPAPFSVIVTLEALPPKVFPLTVIAVVPQVLPLVLLNATAGGFAQPHDTEKLVPVVSHPEEFLTVIVWLPFATPVKEMADWNEPASSLY